MADRERERYEEQHRRRYAEWVRGTYGGPGCRAKIVGRAKYEQIVRAVRGELRRAADNSKFRFWVRSKGFRMGGPAPGLDADGLYVVDTRNGGGPAARDSSRHQPRYKKVAVVDEFFDIIRRVHCSGGDVTARHSGQKRTHRMIMETYAFLPREAVTAFLMGCPQCSTNSATLTAAEILPCALPSLSPSFACSTPVKRDEGTVAGPDKENVSENGGQRTVCNKRKRTVPLKRDAFARGQVESVVDSPKNIHSSSDGTPKNSADGSGCSTLVLSSSSSLHLSSERSTASRSSGGEVQPLDLSWSPLISSATRASSSASPAEEFFYKRRRRVRPKRLNGSRSSAGRRCADADDTSASDWDDGTTRDVGERDTTSGRAGTAEEDAHGTDEEDGPGPAKLRRKAVDVVCRYDKTETTTTSAEVTPAKDTSNTRPAGAGGFGGYEVSDNESEETREKSAALHSPMNKRLNGGGHHPYHMHSRSIMNGLATSSSPSSLSKTLDTITTSSAAHHSFHRHWLDMASDSAANMMDVDGSADDGSMAAAAAAAAAALLFSPPSSVGGGGGGVAGGISPGGPLSTLHPNTHGLAAHHHALSPLAPLALPHSAASVGLTSAHHHHHIQQQLQQYAAAAVAAATAAAAAAAAASTSNDSAASPPPALSMSLPPMAHHYGQGCGQGAGVGGSTKRRGTGGAGLTVQQQLYRRSGTPTSSATSSPSPRPLNSKNDADTTTSSAGLHENGSFSMSGPPTTTTTVLWPPLGLLTAAHQQHHHSLSSPPKFQQLFGSSVNSLTAVTAGSQLLSSLPPPPISSPSSLSYRPVSKDMNGMAVTTTNGSVTGNDIGTGTTGNATNADEEDTAIDEEEDEEDEEDEEEEEEEDLDDEEMEEEDGDEEEEGDKTADGGRAQARRLRRQQMRRLRRLRREGGGNAANIANDCADSGVSTNYHQQWQQPSTTTSTTPSQQQNQQSIGSSSQQHVDPERLKAFNMFVRLFVDENLDRQVPISRQPKDKVQAIIDSCGRQFPELSDRSRKRIRTYLKSCRRNKRNTPQSGGAVSSSPPPSTNPWPANGSSTDSTVQPQRPTPAHLTSAQAETILAVACQRESDNARRMRLGLEPVAQPYPYAVATSTAASNAFQQPAGLNQNGNGTAALHTSSTSSDEDAAGVGDGVFDKSSASAVGTDAERHNGETDDRNGRDLQQEGSVSATGGSGDATIDANSSVVDESNAANVNCGASVTSSSPNNCESAGPTDLSVNKSAATTAAVATATSPSSFGGSGSYAGTTAGFRGLSSSMTSTATSAVNHHHQRRAGGSGSGSSTATGMLQLFPAMATASGCGAPAIPSTASTLGQAAQQSAGSKLLNKADVVTVRQLIAGYRESAAFLLRSADELEHLLLLRG